MVFYNYEHFIISDRPSNRPNEGSNPTESHKPYGINGEYLNGCNYMNLFKDYLLS